MKLHKILPIIFLIIAMMISCSQETVINENISGEATTPDTKICVNIKTENSRTVRPEITKWEITVTNKSDANLKFSRTIDGKATSATFVNVTDGEYEITVRGIHEDSNRKTIILTANPTFEVKPNTVNVCEIIPEDYFPDPIINNDGSSSTPAGNLSIQISGLKDLFTEGETLLLTCTKLPETNNESDTTCDLIFSEEGKISGVIHGIPVGSYKIEISNSKNLNLVKDPVVNIYDNTTTEINWEWNYDSDKIKADQDLKGIKIPVWNKSVTATGGNQLPSGEYGAEYIPARNGYLTANALFAEPIWEDEFYNFEYERDDGSTISATVNKGKLEFINCTYDEIGDLWVLSGTSEMKEFFDEDGSGDEWRYCYVLKNVSTGENYKFSYGDNLAPDFSVFVDGTNEYYLIGCNDSQLKLLKLSDTKIEDFEIASPIDLTNITALYISRNSNTDEIPIYIAITSSDDNGTTAKIYTGTISTDDTTGTPTLNINTVQSTLSLGISDFTDGTIQNSDFYNSAFAISDMYINEDKSKLYVTASCVNYNGNSWNNNQNYGFYHSFGGLFVYELDEAGNLKKDDDGSITVESYGINNNEITTIDPETENDIDPNPFLTTGGNGVFELESNIMQAENEKSPYFAGPRYIIPSGNDLLIVDSGFYGMYKSEYKQLTDCEKRNRIFTFNINKNNDESEGLKFNSLTKVDDSISFDYDYLTSSRQY